MRSSALDAVGTAEGAGHGELLGQGGEVQDILVGNAPPGPFCVGVLLLWHQGWVQL